MLSLLRKRVTYTNMIVTLALVFAMTGGAYAAGKYIITSTKQISPKVLKTLQGKTGPAGVAGAQGPQGPVGPQGTPGSKGENGTAGITGKEGPTGKTGVTGKEGKEGEKGEPWPVGGLPKGATEMGTWTAVGMPVKALGRKEVVATAIAFTVPLAKPLLEAEEKVHVIETGATDPSGCKGTVHAPEADSGNLCIFEHEAAANVGSMSVFAPELGEGEAAGRSGTMLLVVPKTAGESISAFGTWAVTG